MWHGKPVARKCTEIILTALFLQCWCCSCRRADAGETTPVYENETAFRIKPLQDRLAALEQEEIDGILAHTET